MQSRVSFGFVACVLVVLCHATSPDVPPSVNCSESSLPQDSPCTRALNPLPGVFIVPKPQRHVIPPQSGFDRAQDQSVLASNHHISRSQPGRIPMFSSDKGFIALPMPDDLYDRLVGVLKAVRSRKAKEYNIAGYLNNNDGPNTSPTYMLEIDWSTKEWVLARLKPMLEEWIGGDIPLEAKACYGIREYTRGSRLHTHVDRGDTHLISAILQLGQEEMDSPWPLEIEDFDHQFYDVYIPPKTMVFYEGAKLHHGRPHQLLGNSFFNAFAHFAPKGWPQQKVNRPFQRAPEHSGL